MTFGMIKSLSLILKGHYDWQKLVNNNSLSKLQILQLIQQVYDVCILLL